MTEDQAEKIHLVLTVIAVGVWTIAIYVSLYVTFAFMPYARHWWRGFLRGLGFKVKQPPTCRRKGMTVSGSTGCDCLFCHLDRNCTESICDDAGSRDTCEGCQKPSTHGLQQCPECKKRLCIDRCTAIGMPCMKCHAEKRHDRS